MDLNFTLLRKPKLELLQKTRFKTRFQSQDNLSRYAAGTGTAETA